MPVSTTEYRVFLASPSDVAAERKVVAEAIEQINKVWASSQNIRLVLVSWEDDTVPAIGEDVQSVVSEQIGDGYDIFLGLLWHRCGTPTPRASSGTLEEFERAYELAKSDESRKLMVYFKAAPLPYDVDTEQLGKVRAFRGSLGDRGVYWWEFEDADSLRATLVSHLSKVLRSLLAVKSIGTPVEATPHPVAKAPSEDSGGVLQEEDMDAGIFDLMETAEDHMQSANGLMEDIGDVLKELGERMNVRAVAVGSAKQAGGGSVSSATARRLINLAAEDMHDATKRLEVSVPQLRARLTKAFECMGVAIATALADGIADPEDMERIRAVGTQFLEAIPSARSQIHEFYTTIESMPRYTKEFGRARRCLSAVTKQLDDSMGDFVKLAINLADIAVAD